MTELFQQALHIDSPWFIKSIDFNAEKKQLNIHVDFKRGSTFADPAPDGESAKMYKAYDTVEKSWQHLNFFEHECHLHARVPRIKRDDSKVRMISPPWEGRVSGFTLLFEALLIQLCKAMPVHNVSQLTGVSDHKIWRVLDTYIDLAKIDENFSDISVIGMDETSITRGHDYITLFVDLKERKTLHISSGKDNQTVVDFVEVLEAKQGDRNAIKQVSCDMSPAFIKGIKGNLPQAEITFDKFHIIKLINEAVDQVRREEGKYTPKLKGTRFIFLKNEVNLTAKQKVTKEELSLAKLNLKAIRAMQIRENFQQIYTAESTEQFEGLLNSWYYWATHSQLAPMVKVAKIIKRHWEGIISWKKSQINNGILEGLNSIIQAAKRKARGYKVKHFKTIAYLLTGKLDFSKVNTNCLPT
ncbi:MAG: ISL3 family transposase [Methylococcaceae bacterium]|nr:ISL3 family transposase [Methylococcaceae bacterium]